MLEKLFVPYEQALSLQKLGFDEECLAWYNYEDFLIFGEDLLLDCYAGEENRPITPTWQQAFRWFIEKYNIISHIHYDMYDKIYYFNYYYTTECEMSEDSLGNKTYEEAELECLKKLIELCEKKH